MLSEDRIQIRSSQDTAIRSAAALQLGSGDSLRRGGTHPMPNGANISLTAARSQHTPAQA
jgi:hypothetical protein